MLFLKSFFSQEKNKKENVALHAISESDENRAETAENLAANGLCDWGKKFCSLPIWRQKLALDGLLVFSFLVCFITLIFVISHRNTQLFHLIEQLEHKNTSLLTDQIADMHEQLDKLSNSTQHSSQNQVVFTQLHEKLSLLEKNIPGIAKSEELKKMAFDMNTHFDHLEKTVSSNGEPKKYLDAKALPFRMISIDVIAQQAFISVDFDHRILPLGVGDSLSGWKVVRVDYGAVEAELVNTNGQYLKLSAPNAIVATEDNLK